MNITFSNKGLIDLRNISSFGVSVKNTSNPIGMFGTGLKYAIAVLLRTKHKITLFCGQERYDFDARVEDVRGEPQTFVYMNDQRMPFTTHLGHTWELWQAYRELYCNALDEGGFTARFKELAGAEGETRICVVGDGLQQVHDDRHKYILDLALTPVYADDSLEIYDMPNTGIFYRGMLAGRCEKPTLFTYNVLETKRLTEDRTFEHDWSVLSTVALAVQRSDLPGNVLDAILLAQDTHYEHKLTFYKENYVRTSEDFLQACARNATDFARLNRTAYVVWQARAGDDHVDTGLELAPSDRQMFDDAVAVLRAVGVDVRQYPIRVLQDLGNGVLGLASNGRILLSYEAFLRGDRTLIGTLYEEYVHLKHGYGDCSRELQNHLLDRLVTAWVLAHRTRENHEDNDGNCND